MVVTLAVNSKAIKLNRENDAVVVQWTASEDNHVAYYQIERAVDADKVITMGRTNVFCGTRSVAVYKWIDANPVNGLSYYRVKQVDKDGLISYSEIVKYIFNRAAGSITAYPNPVTGFEIKLKFETMKAGTYLIRILNSSGQVVNQKKYLDEGVSKTEIIRMPSNISSGNYKVQLIGDDTRAFNIIVL